MTVKSAKQQRCGRAWQSYLVSDADLGYGRPPCNLPVSHIIGCNPSGRKQTWRSLLVVAHRDKQAHCYQLEQFPADSVRANEESSATIGPRIATGFVRRVVALRDEHYPNGRATAGAYSYTRPGRRGRCVRLVRSGGG